MPVQTSFPGVYVVERPSGVRTITGVATSVTAFVGVTRMGPVNEPRRLRSVADFVRIFGAPLDADRPMGHMVGHFFTNGGGEAVVVRVANQATAAAVTLSNADGEVLELAARDPGAFATRIGPSGLEATVEYGTSTNPNDLFSLVLSLFGQDPRTGQPVLLAQETYLNLSMSPRHPAYAVTALERSALVTAAEPETPATSADNGHSTSRDALPDTITFGAGNNLLRVAVDGGAPVDVTLFPDDTQGTGTIDAAPGEVVTELTARFDDAGIGVTPSLDNDRLRLQSDTTGADSAVVVLPAPGADASKDLRLGLAFGGEEVSGAASLRPLETGRNPAGFSGGSDGGTVGAADLVPPGGSGGIFALSTLLFPRFNLLCLPGLTTDDDQALGAALAYCRQERAFLLVDTPSDWTVDPPELGSLPALGEHGAVYYPRLRQVEVGLGGSASELDLPASGAVAGVMARIDAARGVWKAPAGLEAGIAGIAGLDRPTDDALSGLLNPRGVNVLRTFPGAGTVVWGVRTLKGDDTQASEFKYIPVRRLTNFIASSLYLGTQFAVFEPNDPELWGQLRLAVGTFMRGLFRQGAFQQSSSRAETDSFFVTCDETTNPQAEIDLGRVNVVVGFAPLKPAEFVIITITQISQLEA